MKKILLVLFQLLITFSFSIFAQQLTLIQNNEKGIYAKGEEIILQAELKDVDVDSLTLRIHYNFTKTETTIVKFTGEQTTVYKKAFNEPVSLVFDAKAEIRRASLGAVVAPDEFEPGTKRPKKFKKYWNKEKKMLRKLPMEIKSEPVDDVEKGYECINVELNCTGPKPARGYFAKPVNAKPKSLPIVLFVHAAGVKGDWCLSKPSTAVNYAKMGNGTLAFDLSAHGMLNGQPAEYYENLENGELKGYYHSGVENREDVYFRGMYLRLIRTLDFLTQQPEWDGKRILVLGESQGGGQALAAAGLDNRVTAVVATVPAMCDFGGTLVNRKGGWPDPFGLDKDQNKMLKALPWFDTAHLLKESKATIVTEIGLLDRTCPPTSVYAAINQSRGKKIIYTAPYRGHHLNQKQFQKEWEETIYKTKMKFIEDYLK